MHFKFGLCYLLWPVENVEDFGISVSDSPVMICEILIPFVCHGLQLRFFFLKLLFLSEGVLLSFYSIIFHLLHQLIIEHCFLVHFLVIMEPVGNVEHVVVMAVFQLDLRISRVVVIVSGSLIVVHVQLILQIQVSQEVLLVYLVRAFILSQGIMLIPDILQVILLTFLFPLPDIMLVIHL